MVPVPSEFSLDGGGLRGVFTAAMLAGLEEKAGRRLADCFDLIAGTSTGGIITLGIAAGLPARDILAFYESKGPRVFPPSTGWAGLRARLSRAWSPKHAQAPLRSALERVFGTLTLNDLQTRIVVPAFNAAVGDVRVFKTPHDPRVTEDQYRRVVDVALATSAAPLYLPALATVDGERLIDGGLWANNPVVAGLLEAIVVLHQPRQSLVVLSIGTPSPPFHLDPSTGEGGWWQWIMDPTVPSASCSRRKWRAHMHKWCSSLNGTSGDIYGSLRSFVQVDLLLDRPKDVPDLKGLC